MLINFSPVIQALTKLRERFPERLSKIKVISGDITEPNLGISSEDRNELIEAVSVVFHCASDVIAKKYLGSSK